MTGLCTVCTECVLSTTNQHVQQVRYRPHYTMSRRVLTVITVRGMDLVVAVLLLVAWKHVA
jgi:hypothetical protein